MPFTACSRLFSRPFAAVECFARRNPMGKLKQGLLVNGLVCVLGMTNGAAKTHTNTVILAGKLTWLTQIRGSWVNRDDRRGRGRDKNNQLVRGLKETLLKTS